MAATKESGYGYSNLLISNEIIKDKIVISFINVALLFID